MPAVTAREAIQGKGRRYCSYRDTRRLDREEFMSHVEVELPLSRGFRAGRSELSPMDISGRMFGVVRRLRRLFSRYISGQFRDGSMRENVMIRSAFRFGIGPLRSLPARAGRSWNLAQEKFPGEECRWRSRGLVHDSG